MAVVAVTGAAGFIGRQVREELKCRGDVVIGISRSPSSEAVPFERTVTEIGSQTDWARALEDVEVVVHCAARAHVLSEQLADPLSAYRTVNVEGTRRLAEQAARYGVRRIVFLSSVKAVGERSKPGRPLYVSDPPSPEDAYGLSKREAELAFLEVCAATGLEGVIIRPPMVYGPGVKGNFLRLMVAIDRGWPLPLSAIDNCRSLVSLANLVDFISISARAPAAAGRTFFVADGEDLSTTALARRLAAALGRRPRLFPVPDTVLSALGTMAGKSAEIERLVGTLQVDLTEAREVLRWSPPCTVEQGLSETVTWFRSRR